MNVFYCLLLTTICAIIVKAEVSSVSSKHIDDHKSHIKATGKDDTAGEIDPMKLYQRLLRKKRMEQTTALKNIIAIPETKKQHSVVNELVSSIIRVISTAKNAIINTKFDPSQGQFPNDNEDLREHIASVIENTPFLCEFILYYPNIVKKEYTKNDEFKELVNWAYKFGHDFGIYDDLTLKFLNLAGQELEIIEREENYVNPYDRSLLQEKMQRDAIQEANEAREAKKKAKKAEEKQKKKEKGPKLSKKEL
uniref:Coiled-coil domain-containing protein 134 n=1 Tax=Panagrolaimus sp. ES5 TaxID=591445 RepID=A0AC34GP03_9BILA